MRIPELGLRSIAVAIAVLAVIDPAVTSQRSTKPEVVVLSVNAASDSALNRRVSAQLAKDFTVMHTPLAAAAATVLVGSHLPTGFHSSSAQRMFAVVPTGASEVANIELVVVPQHVALDTRVPVSARVRVRGARGQSVQARLLANGVIVDRATGQSEGDSAIMTMPLLFVPTVVGAVSLRVEVRVGSGDHFVAADALVNVQNEKWAVLFFDPRPSWMSTFVRRAVERDTRFVVTSRVVTSTNVSTDAGRPPATLDDPSISDLYNAIVVGAPESLGERDIQGLDQFLRWRGGSVVLLFDANKSGRYERLADMGTFTATANSQGAQIADASGDSLAMRATEWMWPVRLPAGATVLAWNERVAAAAPQPIVYAVSAGAGRVIVSGALDAWKFRDTERSGFERFWQRTVAAAAIDAAPAVDVELSEALVRPSSEVVVTVTERRASLATLRAGASTRATASALLEHGDGTAAVVRLWPTGTPGVLRGTVTAPNEPGTYRVAASAEGGTTRAPLQVATDARPPNPTEIELLRAVAVANGGELVPEGQIDQLSSIMKRSFEVQRRPVSWHPMHSAWWLLPFTLALSAEWWLRRRRGLP